MNSIMGHKKLVEILCTKHKNRQKVPKTDVHAQLDADFDLFHNDP
jgi:hypothetical protein